MKEFDKTTGEIIDIDVLVEEVVSKGEASPFGYDPVKDLHPVDPFGRINLYDAFENHNVPTNVSDEVANYNGIDDPDSMLGSPRDVFEAYRMNDAIQRSAKVMSEKSVSPSNGEN